MPVHGHGTLVRGSAHARSAKVSHQLDTHPHFHPGSHHRIAGDGTLQDARREVEIGSEAGELVTQLSKLTSPFLFFFGTGVCSFFYYEPLRPVPDRHLEEKLHISHILCGSGLDSNAEATLVSMSALDVCS